MSTNAQISANRANARRSTGPITAEGKSRSAANPLRHGLASGELFVGYENPADYDALEADLVATYKPANTMEELVVKQLAQHFWLAQRAISKQKEAYQFCKEAVPKELATLIRYQTTNERAFERNRETLSKLQSERRKQEIGFASQTPRKQAEPEPQTLPQPAEKPVEAPAKVSEAPIMPMADPREQSIRQISSISPSANVSEVLLAPNG
jgi:hypothetical protein